MQYVKRPNLEWTTVAWPSVSLLIGMQLEYFILDFKVFNGLGYIFSLLLRMGGRVACLKLEIRLTSALV